MEMHYKGIQIKLKQNFGWQFLFMYFNQEYSGNYMTLDQCKTAAKRWIDDLTIGRDILDGLDV